MTYRATILAEAVPQPRPRVTTRGGHGHAYTPKDHPVNAWRELVRENFTNRERFRACLVRVRIAVAIQRPKSHYTAKGAVKASAPPLPRPDLDNYAKAILDALTDSGIWDDDSQVADLRVMKVWADRSETEITISSIN